MKEKLSVTKSTRIDADEAPELTDNWFKSATLLNSDAIIHSPIAQKNNKAGAMPSTIPAPRTLKRKKATVKTITIAL